jgi:hypothetical protein
MYTICLPPVYKVVPGSGFQVILVKTSQYFLENRREGSREKKGTVKKKRIGRPETSLLCPLLSSISEIASKSPLV